MKTMVGRRIGDTSDDEGILKILRDPTEVVCKIITVELKSILLLSEYHTFLSISQLGEEMSEAEALMKLIQFPLKVLLSSPKRNLLRLISTGDDVLLLCLW